MKRTVCQIRLPYTIHGTMVFKVKGFWKLGLLPVTSRIQNFNS